MEDADARSRARFVSVMNEMGRVLLGRVVLGCAVWLFVVVAIAFTGVLAWHAGGM